MWPVNLICNMGNDTTVRTANCSAPETLSECIRCVAFCFNFAASLNSDRYIPPTAKRERNNKFITLDVEFSSNA